MTDTVTAWGTSLQAAGCSKCGQAYLVPQNRINDTCPNCFAAKLSPQGARLRPEPPELVAPFNISPTQVENALSKWLEKVWLRPSELNTQTLRSRLRKTYIPMFLVDGKVNGAWQAQAGYDYQVVSSQENFSSGQWKTQQITKTRVRWEPRAGTMERDYENIAVPATEDHDSLMKALGDYKIDAAQPYSVEALTESSVRVPTLTPESAWSYAQSGLNHFAANDCQLASDAQHIEEFKFNGDYQNLNWTQLLLPVYTTAYKDDDGKIHRVMINGQSGHVNGKLRASPKTAWLWAGIIAAGAFGCFIVTLLTGLIGLAVPPVFLIAAVLFVVSLIIAVVALVPLIWAWNFNSKNK